MPSLPKYCSREDAMTLVHTIANYWLVRGHKLEIGNGGDIWLEKAGLAKSAADGEANKTEVHWLIRSNMINGRPRSAR